jgi:pyridinium-3,5-biscarboxylic acid mononucleotide sulfurtransferase
VRTLIVGFDLDMTLIDSRAGIAATYDILSAETGRPIDSAVAVARLGPPLEAELAHWFAPEEIPAARNHYRSLYPHTAIEATVLLPGAREAVEAVRGHGGRVVVVTAKYEPFARLHLDHLGVTVDEVVGSCWAEEKGDALRRRGASVYVGDHVGDVMGARRAGALSVAVPTGPVPAEELRAAGADVVLPDLTEFPGWFDEHLLERRVAALTDRLAELGSVVVAFSGGADSAFLLAAAVRTLGPRRVLAATAVSPSLPAEELRQAADLAARLGVRHVTPRTDEMSRSGYRDNGGDRCYFCKAELLDVLRVAARDGGFAYVVTGTNADDVAAGFRPGIRAAAQRGAVTPLSEVGLTKAQIRRLSRRWELPSWDKPAAACLSSRIAYGIQITTQRLARVEQAESALRSMLAEDGVAVANLRVRDLGERVRIEADPEVVRRLTGCARAREAVRAAGFGEAELDVEEFRSGSMNELLSDPARYR